MSPFAAAEPPAVGPSDTIRTSSTSAAGGFEDVVKPRATTPGSGAEELPALRPGGSLFSSAAPLPEAARPQYANGRPYGPEFWGISRQQVSELLHRLRSEPAWDPRGSVYQMVVQLVVPWTRGQGMGYALMINGQSPKEVNVMVSHAWAENAEEFLETVIRSTDDMDVLFICALSLYQPDDGAGPTIAEQIGADMFESPFHKVLSHISDTGNKSRGRVAWQWYGLLSGAYTIFLTLALLAFYWTVMFQGCFATFDSCLIIRQRYVDHKALEFLRRAGVLASAYDWAPCPHVRDLYALFPYGVLVCLALSLLSWLLVNKTGIYRGRLLVVPNHEIDLYSRLWCVFEIHAAHSLKVPVRLAYTLASAGSVSSRAAQCSSLVDSDRIHAAIRSSMHRYEDIDKTVYLVTHAAQWDAIRVALLYGTWLCLVSLGSVQLPCAPTLSDKVDALKTFLLGFIGVYTICAISVYYLVARVAHGRPSRCQVRACAFWLFLCGFAWRVVDVFVDWPAAFIGRGPFIAAFYMALGSFATSCARRRKCCGARSFLPVLTALFFLFFLTLMTMDILIPSAAEENGMQASMHIYPIVAKNATAVISWFWGPVYLCWSAYVRWGVHMRS